MYTSHAHLHLSITSWFLDNQLPQARPGVRHVLIVLTDGNSQEPDLTKAAAHRAAETGLDVFAIGVGRGIGEQELHNIASDAKYAHFYVVVSIASDAKYAHFCVVVNIASDAKYAHFCIVVRIASDAKYAHFCVVVSIASDAKYAHFCVVVSIASDGKYAHFYVVVSIASDGKYFHFCAVNIASDGRALSQVLCSTFIATASTLR